MPKINDDLNEFVYHELRTLAHKFMAQERDNHTLSATDLVHEAFVKLSNSDLTIKNEKHCFRTIARQMRRVLIDYGRNKKANKNNFNKVVLDCTEALGVSDSTPDFQEINKAIDQLLLFDERSAEAIELVYFTNLTQAKAAEYLDVSLATLEREIKFGRAFINKCIQEV